MRAIILAVAALTLFATDASAQNDERQIYSIYTRQASPNLQQQEIQQMQDYQQEYRMGSRRVYPGRENYGRDFGPLTRHPGDYRDAVDRGQWPAGGPAGGRNFSVD